MSNDPRELVARALDSMLHLTGDVRTVAGTCEQDEVLIDLYRGLSDDELRRMGEDVQFGRISPPIVVVVK